MKNQISMIPGYVYDPPTPTERASENRRYKKPIEMFGRGPDGKTCKTCKHVVEHKRDRKWFKCEEWKMTSSAATDIRLKWPACGQYTEASE